MGIHSVMVGEHAVILANGNTILVDISQYRIGWKAIATLTCGGSITNIVERDYYYQFTNHNDIMSDICNLVQFYPEMLGA